MKKKHPNCTFLLYTQNQSSKGIRKEVLQSRLTNFVEEIYHDLSFFKMNCDSEGEKEDRLRAMEGNLEKLKSEVKKKKKVIRKQTMTISALHKKVRDDDDRLGEKISLRNKRNKLKIERIYSEEFGSSNNEESVSIPITSEDGPLQSGFCTPQKQEQISNSSFHSSYCPELPTLTNDKLSTKNNVGSRIDLQNRNRRALFGDQAESSGLDHSISLKKENLEWPFTILDRDERFKIFESCSSQGLPLC